MQRLGLKNLDLISSMQCPACIRMKEEQNELIEDANVDKNSIAYKLKQIQKKKVL